VHSTNTPWRSARIWNVALPCEQVCARVRKDVEENAERALGSSRAISDSVAIKHVHYYIPIFGLLLLVYYLNE